MRTFAGRRQGAATITGIRIPPAISASTASLRHVDRALLLENQVADDQAVVGVDRPLCEHGFGAETTTGPNLVDAEQWETVGTRVSPPAPSLAKRVDKPQP